MFSPESLAIIGISRTSGGLGGRFFLESLQRAGFPGRIYPIHPSAREICGLPAYADISALPEAVDLIIVCLPAPSVPSVLEECGRKGVRNVHILSSGFKELGTPEGMRLEEEIQRQALKSQLNVIGPNCMGPYVPASRLMLWGQIPAAAGSFAFLSQSGTLTQRMSEHAHFTGMGISKAVSFGNLPHSPVFLRPDFPLHPDVPIRPANRNSHRGLAGACRRGRIVTVPRRGTRCSLGPQGDGSGPAPWRS